MKRNIYIISMLRQPMRTLLLFMLIALAAFTFVLRTVEYVTVNRHIDIIAANYRSIGFIPTESNFDDISLAASIISESEFIAFEDRRRQIEAILVGDVVLPDTTGMWRGVPLEEQLRFHVQYFYAYVADIVIFPASPNIVSIRVVIDDVLAGAPEHVFAGQQVWLHFEFNFEYPDAAQAVSDLTVGDRYFFRSHYYIRTTQHGMPITPVRGRMADAIVMTPIDGNDLWFIPVASGQVDFDAMSLGHIPAEAELLRHNQHSVNLRTTIDMTALPILQGRGSVMRLTRGRLLNLDDYLNANQVALICVQYAYHSSLNIGDTITVEIHPNQFVDGVVTGLFGYAGVTDMDVIVRSTPDPANAVTLELEIVGIFDDFVQMGPSFGRGIIYVPDSIIPADIVVQPPIRDMSHHGINWSEGHVPAGWYSFILTDTRYEQQFYFEYRETLANLGIELALFHAGATGFWGAVDPIMLVMTLNMIVFTIVLLMVLLLVAFLYLRQRRRDFAIMRALGMPIKSIMLKLCLSVMLFGVPAAAIGGGLAWNFAISEAREVLEPFAEMAVDEAITIPDPFNRINAPAAIRAAAEAEMSIWWLVSLSGIAVGGLLVIILVGFAIPLKNSILEQLQGNASKSAAAKKAMKSGYAPDAVPVTSKLGDLPKLEFVEVAGAKIKNSLRWVFTNISRSVTKTVLGFAIALFFIFALGWLQETIRSTQAEIDHLYEVTVVHVDVAPIQSPRGGGLSTTFTRQGIINIERSPFPEQIITEAAHNWAAIVPANADGSAPDNWYEIVGFNPEAQRHVNIANDAFDTLLGISSLEAFIADHYVQLVGDGGTDFILRIEIDFAPGFTVADFDYVFDSTIPYPIPVIIPQSIANYFGLAAGDYAFMANAILNPFFHNFYVHPIFIAGVHNEYIHRFGLSQAVLIPITALESLNGWLTLYNHLALTIDTAYNREMATVRAEITDIMMRGTGFAGRDNPHVFFQDEELRVVVSAMAQVLILLEMMYPIAIALAVIIGLAISMLTMLQMAKSAAIMRVLGTTRTRAITILCAEQFAVCLVGLIVGLAVLIGIGLGFGPLELAILAVLYLIGAVAGSIAGAVVIAGKAPLDLLQVRE